MNEINTKSYLSYSLPITSTNVFTGHDGAHIGERIQEFNTFLRQLHQCNNKSYESLTKLSEIQKKTQNDPTKDMKQKLTNHYHTTVKDTENEAVINRRALDIIFEIRSLVKSRQKKLSYGMNNQMGMRRGQLMKILNDSAMTLPLFIGQSIHDNPPPLCGAIPAEPNYSAKIGDLVAALVKNKKEHNWILAEVVHFNSSTNKYEVDDIDEEQKDRHILSKRKVVPLPLRRANPETDPNALFPKGTLVLALYPQTTCFYQAIVKDPPRTANEHYQVLFEDSSYSEGYSPALDVPQRYIIGYKEFKK